MYGMTFDEMMLCAKIFAFAMGDRSVSMTQLDKDAACAMLKRMADQRWDWTEAQKEQYKALVDACKRAGGE